MVVDHDPTFPVHDIIRVTFKDKAPELKYNAVKVPNSIRNLFLDVLRKDYGSSNVDKHNKDKVNKQEQTNKVFTCDIFPERPWRGIVPTYAHLH